MGPAMTVRWLALLLLVLIPSLSWAVPAPLPIFHDHVAKLPSHLPAPASGLAVLADYAHPGAKGIPVYLVNRSGQELKLNAEDFDPYLKLERREADGSWKRAQSHLYSKCGNSYYAVILPTDHFLVFHGYRPAKGQSATVRYRFYQGGQELVSNEGAGLVDEAEMKKAETDAMNIREGNFSRVRSVALGQLLFGTPDDHLHLRREAIYELSRGRLDPAESEKALRELVDQQPDYREIAEESLRYLSLRKKPPVREDAWRLPVKPAK